MQPTMISLSSICLSWQKVYDWYTHKCIQHQSVSVEKRCMMGHTQIQMISLSWEKAYDWNTHKFKWLVQIDKRCMMWSRCFRHSWCLSRHRQACLSHCNLNFQRVALNKGGDTVYIYRLILFYTVTNPLMFQVPKTPTRIYQALWSADAIVLCVY